MRTLFCISFVTVAKISSLKADGALFLLSLDYARASSLVLKLLHSREPNRPFIYKRNRCVYSHTYIYVCVCECVSVCLCVWLGRKKCRDCDREAIIIFISMNIYVRILLPTQFLQFEVSHLFIKKYTHTSNTNFLNNLTEVIKIYSLWNEKSKSLFKKSNYSNKMVYNRWMFLRFA